MATLSAVLFAWIGGSDRRATKLDLSSLNPKVDDIGAIARCLYLDKAQYDKVVLLADKETEDFAFKGWLQQFCERHLSYPVPTFILDLKQVGAMDRPKLYELMRDAITAHLQPDSERSYLLSSGTPAMHLCWTLLAHTEHYRARLLDVSTQKGVEEVEHWLELAHAFLPTLPADAGAFFTACGAEIDVPDIIGEHPAIQQAKGLADLVAKSKRDDYPVLVLGETGSGKESIARLIHDRSKPPEKAKFVAINCGAITESLLESELFGHIKGAFTGADKEKKGLFESAGSGGTVFLDEIGEMPAAMQTKLLRVLQEKKIRPVGSQQEIPINDVRIVAATHRSLIDEVNQGRFRGDLYYRLNVIEIRLPALRERPDDLPLLAKYFLQTINAGLLSTNLQPVKLAEDYEQPLLAHDWPGNIRELQNTLRRAALFANHPESEVGIINAALLRQLILPRPAKPVDYDWSNRSLEQLDLEKVLDEVRYHYYQRLRFELPGLSRSELAKRFGRSPPKLSDLEDHWRKQGREVAARQVRGKGKV